MEIGQLEQLQTQQKSQILAQISDYVMVVKPTGEISYMNEAGVRKFFGEKAEEEKIENSSIRDLYGSSKKNKSFIRFFEKCFAPANGRRKQKDKLEKQEKKTKTLKFQTRKDENLYLEITVQQLEEASQEGTLLVYMHDVSDRFRMHQIERDCAVIFTSLMVGISLFLGFWSLCEFTLKRHLTNTQYTYIIECITFVLFFEVLFFSSFSMRQVGLVPNFSKIKRNTIVTLSIAIAVMWLLLLGRILMIKLGLSGREEFMGGSREGARNYIFTAIIQEFLARGVMQTSIKNLMNVKCQKLFTILVTSLLFALMHIPFGFPFMVAAFMLSVILGIVFEKQGDMWGCAFLHWSCGYLAMCLYF